MDLIKDHGLEKNILYHYICDITNLKKKGYHKLSGFGSLNLNADKNIVKTKKNKWINKYNRKVNIRL